MTCIICESSMTFFVIKEFCLPDLNSAEYWRCDDCGFVVSKTHVEMATSVWERINRAAHAVYQGNDSDPGDPKWITRLYNQARMLDDVQKIGLLKKNGRWLDYACGDGKLSIRLRTVYGINLLNYEPYMPAHHGYLDKRELSPGTFDFVITTSVFEHFRTRQHFDSVEALLSHDGVLGVHTLVCEEVPRDPTWYYMNPVHCSFHTNRSMERLFRQWGYTCSIYNPDAQLWLWFKERADDVERTIAEANSRSEGIRYVFKDAFVDYWKCAPYRRSESNSPNED